MYRASLIALILTVTATASTTRAGGLVQTLPKDGTWVKLYMEAKADAPLKQEVTGTMTLRSVGAATVDGEKCRWIEWQMQGETNGKKQNSIMKFLVREKDLKPGSKSGVTIVRGWKKDNDGDAKELTEAERSSKGPMALFFGGKLKDAKTVKQEKVVDYQKGKLKIPSATTGKLEIQFGENAPADFKIEVTQTIWKHDKVPFGTAAMKLIMKTSFKGNVASTMNMSFTVQDHGTGAKSALPDKK